MNETVLLIPSYQPNEETLAFLKVLTNAITVPIVVVDDGSGEHSRSLFEEIETYGITVLSYAENKGKGYALKQGMRYIVAHYPEARWLVTADSDGQHTLPDIQQMIATYLPISGELLLGVRQFYFQQTPLRSWLGNRLTTLIYYVSTGLWLSDTQTGLRKFACHDVPELLEISGDRFEYEMNQLLVLPTKGYHFSTLPITTVYEEKNQGSHFQLIRDSYLVYRPLLTFLVASLSSSLIDVTLFFLLSLVLGESSGALLFATTLARVLSGLYNYQMNRTMVFHSQTSIRHSFWKYGVLFIAQLLLSWLGVSWFARLLPSVFISKIIVDSCLFVASFVIQRRMVFAN